MRPALLALALAACGALLLSPAQAATLQKGTVEIETAIALDHISYSQSDYGSQTSFAGTLGGGYCLTNLIEVGGGLLYSHDSGESDAVSYSSSKYGASADVTFNFSTPNNLVPYVRAGLGFEGFSGDGYDNAKTALILPYLRAGVRVLVGDSGSLNVSVGYRHEQDSGGSDGLDANSIGFAVGVSIFPWRPK